MAHIYSKGWFVQELKKLGVYKIEGKKLETLKAHVLRNHLAQLQEKNN